MTTAAGSAPATARIQPPRRAWWKVPFQVLGRAAANFVEDRGTQMAAAISYYALFSLFPLAILAAAIFGIVLRNDSLQASAIDAIVGQIPVEKESIETVIQGLANLGPTLSIVALLGTIWTAGALSASIRSALGVAFEEERGRPLLRSKLIDYAVLPVLGMLLIGGVVLTTVWNATRSGVTERYDILPQSLLWFWDAGAITITLTLSFSMFLFIYWLLPNRRIQLRYAWPGALVAAIAFEAVKYGFAIYLANFNDYQIYGSLAGAMILLFWVFLSSNIMLFGAEIANEIPHVVNAEPRHGFEEDEGDWRRSLWSFIRGLALAPGDRPHHEQTRYATASSALEAPAPPPAADSAPTAAPALAPEEPTQAAG